MFKKLIIILLLATSCFFAADFVLAQSPEVGIAYAENLDLQGGGNDVRDFLTRTVQIILGFLGIIAVLFIMWGGWLWMTSNGDPVQLEKAKKTLINAIIGLIIMLSAFMIVTWIMNTTSSSILSPSSCGAGPACVGTQVCCSGGCQAPPCGSIIVTPDSFVITKFAPYDGYIEAPRNTRVKVFFNRAILSTVTQTQLENNFVIEKVTQDLDTVPNTTGLPTVVPGSVEISSNRKSLIFAADADCGNEASTTNCFDQWSEFEITIDGSSQIVSSVGGLTGITTSNFSTNDSIDTEAPIATIIPRQMCSDFDGSITSIIGSSTVYGFARDDVAVSEINFSKEGISPASAKILSGVVPGNTQRYQQAEHIYDTAPMAVGDEYSFILDVFDLVDSVGTSSFETIIREPHCCNGVQDSTETEVDCGGTDCDACGGSPIIHWITPDGGFCRLASDEPTNTFCLDDSACGAGETCDLSTPNGAEGSYVTVSGKYFGSTAGEVLFSDRNGNVGVATLASCVDSWQDDQIIVVVPNGLLALATGTVITVTRISDNKFDTNAIDGNGPYFDFVLNGIQRPGICSVTPDNGTSNTLITYQGIKLINNSEAQFGTVLDSITALNSDFIGAPDTTGTAMVPNIQDKRTTTFIKNPGLVNSNYLKFTKTKDPYTGPYISSFNPGEGPEDQYVTIYGDGFGSPSTVNIGSGGEYHVYFDADHNLSTISDQEEASYDFPDVCENSIWSDSQIVIKVPNGLVDLTDYYFVIDINGVIIDSQGAIGEDGASQETFEYNESLALKPGLCKVSPVMGPNGTAIKLWGEYFNIPDITDSKVLFHLNEEVSGFDSTNWQISGDADEIDTNVTADAITGLVKVEDKDGEIGNGLNFRIGVCSDDPNPDEACGMNILNPDIVCCPAGTVGEGNCEDDIDNCYGILSSSVYEWGFETGATSSPFIPCFDPGGTTPLCNPLNGACSTPGSFCDPVTCSCETTPGESCAGFDLLQCDDGYFCPNSPGKCDIGLFSGTPASCDCDDYFSGAGLSYNDTENKCEDTLSTCSVDEEGLVGTVDLSLYSAYCGLADGNYYWQMDPNGGSCPDSNWILNNIDDCTLVNGSDGVICTPCSGSLDYSCVQNGGTDNTGTCMVNNEICSNSSTGCDANDLCIEPNNPSNSCECCCEIANGSGDCCSFEFPVGSGTFKSLTCEGECGSDAVGPDADIYGNCTGCTIDENGDGTISTSDQALSDDACNCSGTNGKYCETGAAGGEGVCRDCAQLPDTTECSTHSATCCVDAVNSDACRGGDGTILGGGFCAYYECAVAGGCDSSNPASTGVFRDLSTCTSGCPSDGPNPGESCFDTVAGNCGLTCNMPAIFSCRGASACLGTACPVGDTSCRCCCDTSVPDSCAAAGLTDLNCMESAPCSGGDRGLCCGCGEDTQCDTGTPYDVGCGFDTCCRPRPFVIDRMPTEDNSNVCRNVLVSAEFNEPMNISSFAGNILLVGDYEFDTCATNTQFLTLDGKSGEEKYKNVFVRVFYKLLSNVALFFKSILPIKLSAYFDLDLTHNYCAVGGSSGGYSNAAGNGVIQFSINDVLDADRNYYVIIKGDDDLNSSGGVKNAYNVGMNAGAGSSHASLSTNDSNQKTFNGIYFENAYIWSFRTMDLNVANNGICEIDYIEMIPESWLFKTNKNDLNEVDIDALDNNYNTTDDSDKEFVAIAVGPGDIDITPIAGKYSWTWTWTSGNDAVAGIVTSPLVANLVSNKSLVRANNTAVDGHTEVDATATINSNTIGAASGPFVGTADVYVFLCDNPWPPFSQGPTPPAGNWEPWEDENANCTIGTECDNTNYEIYYCRDLGNDSTADDLPAILDENTVIRGRSNFTCKGGYYSGLDCAMGSTDCELPVVPATHTCNNGVCDGEVTDGGKCIVDSNCDSSGACEGVLKDSYFFREALPDISSIDLKIDATNGIPTEGESVELNWIGIFPPPGETLDYYIIHYGTISGNYSGFVEVTLSDLETTYPGRVAYTVTGLTNNITYYFSITAKYVSGAESEYSIEVSGIPKDSSQTGIPAGFVVILKDSQAELSWDANTGDDTAGYEFCYGMSAAGVCANIVDMGNDTVLEIDNLNNGVTYYFGVSAYDNTGNSSSINSLTGMPFAEIYSPQAVASSTNNAVIDLFWNLDLSGANNSGVGNVRIYWGTNPTSLVAVDLGSTPSSYSRTGLIANTKYYFQLATIDNSGSNLESPLTTIIEEWTNN